MSGVLFRNARVLDGSGREPFAGDVLVKGNRIAEIGEAGKVIVHGQAQIIDCAGATLMPGLVEAHAHLSFLDAATPHAFTALPRKSTCWQHSSTRGST